MTNHLKVAWSGPRNPLKNFDASNDISGTIKTRIVKFCMQVDCVKS